MILSDLDFCFFIYIIIFNYQNNSNIPKADNSGIVILYMTSSICTFLEAELLTYLGLNKAKTVFRVRTLITRLWYVYSDDVQSIQDEFSQTIVRWIAKG